MVDLIKNLKEDILKSGLPTEIKVSRELIDDGWNVRNQYAYVDRMTHKIRTIDILALKKFKNILNFHFFIECKKSVDHQWIFYTVPSDSVGLQTQIGDYIGRSKYLDEMLGRIKEIEERKRIQSKYQTLINTLFPQFLNPQKKSWNNKLCTIS